METKYIRPNMKYWSAEELNRIEASMSGGSSSGGSPVSPPVWVPPVEVMSATYDGEYLNVKYWVNRSHNSSIQIGYEYAISLGLNAYNPEYGANISNSRGMHTVSMRVINYMCEIRVCTRVVSGTGVVSSVDRTNIFLYSMPSIHKTTYSTINLVDSLIWKGFWFGVDLVIAKYAADVIRIAWNTISTANEVDGLIDSKLLNVPHIHVGQLYRFDWYYVGKKVHLDLDIWDKESDYYTYNLPPDFSYHHEGSIPLFNR